MKKIVAIISILFLFSCKKENNSNTIDFSLLEKYNWQMVISGNVKSPFDPSQNIPISDTFLYSFNKQVFVEKYQISTTSFGLSGDGHPSSYVSKDQYERSGKYNVNPNDNTIAFEGSYHALCNDRMSIEKRDTIVNFSYKIRIIELSRSGMTFQFDAISQDTIPFYLSTDVIIHKMPELPFGHFSPCTYLPIGK